MQIEDSKLKLFKRIILTLKDFMKKCKLKNDTMNESEIRKSL